MIKAKTKKQNLANREVLLFCSNWRIRRPEVFVEDVSVEPREDPVKNGACLRNVRPRRGL